MMKIKLFSLFILLLLCVTLAEKANDEAIKKSFFFGRSADIILRPKNYLPNDDSVLITINDKGTLSDPIADIDIAYSLWAPSHGIDSADQSLPTNLLNDHDLFSKTKLNLLFTIDNLGNDILSKYSLKVRGGEQRTVLQTAYAQDSISLLTSIISGREPRTHGIIGSKWQSKTGHLISAFKSSNTMSLVNNYPDLLSKLFVGRSLVFGASADFQIASTLSAHPALYADHPFWNDFGFYYDPSLESYESLYPFAVFEPDLMLSKATLLAPSWEKTIGGVKMSCDGKSFDIEVPEKDIYGTYKPDSSDEITLLAEIKFLLTTLDVMATKENWMKLIADDSPDYIAFGFSSLGKIKDMHGETSDKFRAALYAVDALIAHATAAFEKLYAGSVHAHAIFLNPPRVSFPGKISQIVSNSLSAHLLNPGLLHLPSVYISRSAPLKQVCNSLTIELEVEDVEVICPSLEMNLAGSAEEFRPYEFVMTEPHATNNTNNPITYLDVFVFQIMFWFTIAMALALVFSSLAVYAIDIPATSNLIRQMPNLFHDPHQQRNLW